MAFKFPEVLATFCCVYNRCLNKCLTLMVKVKCQVLGHITGCLLICLPRSEKEPQDLIKEAVTVRRSLERTERGFCFDSFSSMPSCKEK